MTDREKPRFHVEGQTSMAGPRWLIWDGEKHYIRFRNIADQADAHIICDALNSRTPTPDGEFIHRMPTSLDPSLEGPAEADGELVEAVARAIAGHFGPDFDQLPADRAEARRLAREGGDFNGNDKAGVLDAATAALSVIEQRVRDDEWQPIETAPKNEWVLCHEAHSNHDIRGDYYAGCLIGDGEDACWLAACGQYVTSAPEPTHWCPLPTPPASGEG